MKKITSIKKLQLKANKIRQEIIKMLLEAGSGHPAGALGMADIFSVLYFGNILKYKNKQPDWESRDRLILSNGHICPVLYASMALAGYFKVDELKTLRKLGSRLQGHPSRQDLPGIETAAGSLGQGISVAVGKALALKLKKSKSKVFCITSDGEHNEGSTWEAIMSANKFKLNNLINIIDRNHIQISGKTEKVMPLGNLLKKYEEFGWQVYEIDGHDYSQIIKVLTKAKLSKNKPVCIVANVVPGKGVKFMEGRAEWHGRVPNLKETNIALEQLNSL